MNRLSRLKVGKNSLWFVFSLLTSLFCLGTNTLHAQFPSEDELARLELLDNIEKLKAGEMLAIEFEELARFNDRGLLSASNLHLWLKLLDEGCKKIAPISYDLVSTKSRQEIDQLKKWFLRVFEWNLAKAETIDEFFKLLREFYNPHKKSHRALLRAEGVRSFLRLVKSSRELNEFASIYVGSDISMVHASKRLDFVPVMAARAFDADRPGYNLYAALIREIFYLGGWTPIGREIDLKKVDAYFLFLNSILSEILRMQPSPSIDPDQTSDLVEEFRRWKNNGGGVVLFSPVFFFDQTDPRGRVIRFRFPESRSVIDRQWVPQEIVDRNWDYKLAYFGLGQFVFLSGLAKGITFDASMPALTAFKAAAMIVLGAGMCAYALEQIGPGIMDRRKAQRSLKAGS